MKLAIFLTSCLTVAIITACSVKDQDKQETQTKVQMVKIAAITIHAADNKIKAQVLAEVADSDYLRTMGLMNRESMAQNEGMLFVFEDETMQSFWMKNTRLPLDLLFINQNLKIVSISREAQPYKTTPIPSMYPAKYVLELIGGFCDMYGVESGNHLKIKYNSQLK